MRTQRVNTSATTLSRLKSYRVEFSQFVARRSSEFIKLTLIATCASGLFVSGCAKSSSQRLTEDAGKAALDAEKELAAQREREALVAQEEQKKREEARVVLSSAAKTVDSPLADMLKEDKPQEKPFLVQESAASKDSASAWDKLIAEHLAEQSVKQQTAPTSPPVAELPATPVPAVAANARPFPGAAEPALQSQRPVASPTDSLMDWSREQKQVSEEPKVADVAPQAKEEAVNPHKLRVQALLSEAHSQEIRGELKAAYRSALLAQTIAEQNGVQFDAAEEQPQQFVGTISKRLWGGESVAAAKPEPKPEQPVPAVAKPQIQPQHRHVVAQQDLRKSLEDKDDASSSFPTWTGSGSTSTSTKRAESNYDSVFARANGQTQWTAVQANEPASLDARPEQEASLKQRALLDAPKSSPTLAPTQPEKPESQKLQLKAPSFQQWESTEVSKPPLVAHADEVTPVEAEQEENPFVQHAVVRQELELIKPEPSPFPGEFQSIEAMPSPETTELANLDETITTWPSGESETVSSQSEPASGTRWGVIGFIAAIIAGAIGAKLSRRSSDDENEPSPISLAKAAPEESESDAQQDDDDGHHLKISRAA